MIALTGGIASGKSLVARMIRECGIPVIDTDEIARQVVAPGQPAWRRLREAFGPEYFGPDGALDRAALAAHVFADPKARRTLEAITHPAVFDAVDQQVAALRGLPHPPRIIVVAVPLLYEVAAQDRFDGVVVVHATRAQQIARLMGTRRYTREEAEARIAAQLPAAHKRARADWVIENTGAIARTRTQVDALVATWQEIAR